MQKGLILLLSLLFSFALPGQKNGEIKALVTAKQTGDTIAGCTAFILQPDSLRGRMVISDGKGLCRFNPVPEGKYTLVFSYPGYKSDTISNIPVSAVKTTYLSEKLIPLTHTDPDKKKNSKKKSPVKTSKRNPVLQGKIIDGNTKETVPFAVLIATGSDQKKCGVYTDMDGNYKLELPAAGKYLLEYKMIGYHTEFIPLVADSFREYRLDISLCELGIELLDVANPVRQRGGRAKTDSLSGSDTVFVITGGLPDAIYHDSVKRIAAFSIDSFKIYHVRKINGDYLSSDILKSGKMYQFNDSVYYFNHGSCPQYACYIKRGKQLIQYGGYNNNTPTEIGFYRRGKHYLLKSGSATARVKKY